MKYAKLSNSALKVSHICMGCMGFKGTPSTGSTPGPWTRSTLADHQAGASSWGVNFLTPPSPIKAAPARQYLGRALKDFARREDVVVATSSCPARQRRSHLASAAREHIKR